MRIDKVFAAELVGTFVLVLAGCGAIIVDELSGGLLGVFGISVVFGLSVMAVIYTLGSVSGAHINPAVSIGLWAAGRLPGSHLPLYIFAQLAGALIAALCLRSLFPLHESLGSTNPAIPPAQAVLVEGMISLLLMLTILTVTTAPQAIQKRFNGVVIGGVVALLAFSAGPVTGASMNPARSIGPALISGEVGQLWIYLIAPILGALCATPCCRILSKDCCPTQTNNAAA
jgi:aquaporin Z